MINEEKCVFYGDQRCQRTGFMVIIPIGAVFKTELS
jgi:hypothetical protein